MPNDGEHNKGAMGELEVSYSRGPSSSLSTLVCLNTEYFGPDHKQPRQPYN